MERREAIQTLEARTLKLEAEVVALRLRLDRLDRLLPGNGGTRSFGVGPHPELPSPSLIPRVEAE